MPFHLPRPKLAGIPWKVLGDPSLEITACQTLQERDTLPETKSCRLPRLRGEESQGSDVGGRFTKNLLISKWVEKWNKVKILLAQGQFFTSSYRILQACPLCARHERHDEWSTVKLRIMLYNQQLCLHYHCHLIYQEIGTHPPKVMPMERIPSIWVPSDCF